MQWIEANWLLILIALLVTVAIAWYIFHAARRTRITGETRDVLDEGAAPAARNQALIDSPAARAGEPAPVPPSAPSVPPAAAAPEHAAASAPSTGASIETGGSGDDLTRIKGVGPKLAEQLRSMGITRFAQIAAWSDADVERIDAQLGRFQGRIQRDSWVEQAGYLAANDIEGFQARFGKLN